MKCNRVSCDSFFHDYQFVAPERVEEEEEENEDVKEMMMMMKKKMKLRLFRIPSKYTPSSYK